LIADAIVMAAGLGTRLAPLTERWAKAVLPIDGRPVIATLLRDLAAAGVERATVVTGHLGHQVEALVREGFPLEVRCARQPEPDGSADAVRCGFTVAPVLVVAADTLFAPGAIARFGGAFAASDAGGALATDGPLWALRQPVVDRLCLDAKPYELLNAFRRAEADGIAILRAEVGPIRDLTRPEDLVHENFPYLGGLPGP
jgi:GTP:adenosylcobinamide-phosphate guanylyltransferase